MTKRTILFMTANPSGTDPRALDREARSIRAELKGSGYRDRFEFETRWAAEPLDLLRELRDLKPTVVHFSGRGTHDGLLFQTAEGRAQVVSPAAIAETFGAAGGSVKVVVLSACYSQVSAEALLAHVDCVVGMGSSIHDDAARSFAIGFYGALSATSCAGSIPTRSPTMHIAIRCRASRAVGSPASRRWGIPGSS